VYIVESIDFPVVSPLCSQVEDVDYAIYICVCVRYACKFGFYFFVSCNTTALNIRAMMKSKTEATYGPPIPATYDSPPQNNATEIASTNIQTKAIIKFLLSIVIYLPFEKLSMIILCFS